MKKLTIFLSLFFITACQKDKIQVTDIEITKSSNYSYYFPGETITLTALLQPLIVKDQRVKWIIDKPEVASIYYDWMENKNTGCVVITKAPGAAMIKAEAKNGGISRSVIIIVISGKR